MNNKIIKLSAIIGAFVILIWINPMAYNNATERTVVTTLTGKQFVQFAAGTYWEGFFAHKTVWPNQISISHQDTVPDYNISDNTIEIGKITVRFNDATTAKASGITQYILPSTEKEMLEIHNAHKTPEALVKRRLAPYTQECLQSSAQLMSSEMHYSGGRAQMTQDYIDQLRNGSFLLKISAITVYDSIEKMQKRTYEVTMQQDKNNQPKRKFSSIKEYGISVGDAQITDVDYERAVDDMLRKKIDAATKSSVSKQELMTAQQQALTAKAQGERKLVEIEYVTKQNQTKVLVDAETQVQLAEKDREKQEIALKASRLEAEKIKTLADANAYEKRTGMQANGALEQKLDAWLQERKYAWDAFAKFQGSLVPQFQTGSNTSNGFDWMQVMGMRAMKDLTLDTKTK